MPFAMTNRFAIKTELLIHEKQEIVFCSAVLLGLGHN